MSAVKYAANDWSMLPPPPWEPEQVADWEAAHGHDVRLLCDIRTCEVVIADYEGAICALESVAALHKPDPDGGRGYTDNGYGTIDPACAVCGKSDEYAVPWPCSTFTTANRALARLRDEVPA